MGLEGAEQNAQDGADQLRVMGQVEAQAFGQGEDPLADRQGLQHGVAQVGCHPDHAASAAGSRSPARLHAGAAGAWLDRAGAHPRQWGRNGAHGHGGPAGPAIEIFEQLRGEAGDRQVENAHIRVIQNMGGSGASSVVVARLPS